MRGWARSVKDFEVDGEAIQVGSSENENKAGRLGEGGWLGDQALLSTCAPARQWHLAQLSCLWSCQLVSAVTVKAVPSNQ